MTEPQCEAELARQLSAPCSPAQYTMKPTGRDNTINVGNHQTTNNLHVDFHAFSEAADKISASSSTCLSIEIDKHQGYYTHRHGESDLVATLLQLAVEAVPKTFILHGMTGTGKTSFSRKYARDHSSGRPGSPYSRSWWIGANSLQVFQNDLLAATSTDIHSNRTDTFWTRSVRRYLKCCEKPWLLIVDDAHRDVLKILHRIIPKTGSGLVLVNTLIRPEGFIDERLGYTKTEWSCLAPDEAVRLLKCNAGDRDSNDSAYAQIAEQIHHLPFALDLAGTYLREKNTGDFPITPNVYLNKLRQYRSEILRHGETERQSVYGVIYASVSQVQKQVHEEFCGDGDDGFVLDALRLLSFFLPENLPLDQMPFGNEAQSEWIQRRLEVLLGAYPCSQWSAKWEILLQHLDTYHLLHLTSGKMGTTYSMHFLFLSWANDTMRREEKKYMQWRMTAAVILASARIFSGAGMASENVVLLTKLYPHWKLVQSSVLGNRRQHCGLVNFIFDKNLEADSPRAQVYQDIAFEQIEVNKACGLWQEVFPYCERLFHSRQSTASSPEKITEARAQLAECCEFLGNHNEALRHRQVILEQTSARQDSDECFEAIIAYTKSLTKVKAFEEARKLLETCLHELTGKYEEADIRIIHVKKRLGVLCDRVADHKNAIRYREVVLRKLEQNHRERRLEIRDAQVDLAYSYGNGNGDQKKLAQKIYRKVLREEEQHLPSDHPRVLLARANLAWGLIISPSKTRLSEARSLTIDILRDRRQLLGERHELTIRARIMLAACETRIDPTQSFDRVLGELKDCFTALKDPNEAYDTSRSWAMEELAIAIFEAESVSLSIRQYGLLVNIMLHQDNEKKYGLQSPKSVVSAKLLAEALEYHGCWQTALPLRRQVAEYLCSSRENVDDERLRAQCRLAVNLTESPHVEHQQEADEVFSLIMAAVRARLEMPRFSETDFGLYALEYAEFLGQHGRFDDANAILEEFISFSETVAYVDDDAVQQARCIQQQNQQQTQQQNQQHACKLDRSYLPHPDFLEFKEQSLSTPFENNLQTDYPGISVRNGGQAIKRILVWEQRAWEDGTSMSAFLALPLLQERETAHSRWPYYVRLSFVPIWVRYVKSFQWLPSLSRVMLGLTLFAGAFFIDHNWHRI